MKPAGPNTEIRIVPTAEALAQKAAERIISVASNAIKERGQFTLALAGGSTPEKTYALLAAPDRVGRIEWTKTLLFFGDERFVPHDDPRSNCGMARRSLIVPANLAAERVFAIPTDTASPADSATAYTQTLRQAFGVTGDTLPQFDLILLGLGDDGHTASLFPGKPAIHEKTAWVTSSPPGILPPPVDRVTFTFPLINAAREVVFLVAGASKVGPLRDVIKGPTTLEQRPAVGVKPVDGKLTWLLDQAAGSVLTQ